VHLHDRFVVCDALGLGGDMVVGVDIAPSVSFTKPTVAPFARSLFTASRLGLRIFGELALLLWFHGLVWFGYHLVNKVVKGAASEILFAQVAILTGVHFP
jgi:hypothetical protein